MVTKTEKVQARREGKLFALLSCASRILIVRTLSKNKGKKLTVQDIADELDMTHSAVSHQLAILFTAKVAAYERRGRVAYYAIAGTTEGKRVEKLAKDVNGKV